MARPPLGVGKHGSIRVTHEGGQWVARCRFRRLNGATVRVERWVSSKTAATHNLQDELPNRAGERTTMLSASSRFADAAEVYLVTAQSRAEQPGPRARTDRRTQRKAQDPAAGTDH